MGHGGRNESTPRLVAAMNDNKYRLDGSPYPDTAEGLLEWATDFQDQRGRIVRQETLWNGIWVSTVWLGLDHNFGRSGPPLIFETMAFNNIIEDYMEPITTNRAFGFPDIPGRSFSPDLGIQERYSTLRDSEMGHAWWKYQCSSIRFTLHLWWSRIMENYYDVR